MWPQKALVELKFNKILKLVFSEGVHLTIRKCGDVLGDLARTLAV
jgi:hypothetical protein